MKGTEPIFNIAVVLDRKGPKRLQITWTLSTCTHTVLFPLVTRAALCFTGLCRIAFYPLFKNQQQTIAYKKCLARSANPQTSIFSTDNWNTPSSITTPCSFQATCLHLTFLCLFNLSTQNSTKNICTCHSLLETNSDQHLFTKSTNRLQIMCLINSDWVTVQNTKYFTAYSKMLEEFGTLSPFFFKKITTPYTTPLENKPGFFYLPTIKNFYTLHFVIRNLCP